MKTINKAKLSLFLISISPRFLTRLFKTSDDNYTPLQARSNGGHLLQAVISKLFEAQAHGYHNGMGLEE